MTHVKRCGLITINHQYYITNICVVLSHYLLISVATLWGTQGRSEIASSGCETRSTTILRWHYRHRPAAISPGIRHTFAGSAFAFSALGQPHKRSLSCSVWHMYASTLIAEKVVCAVYCSSKNCILSCTWTIRNHTLLLYMLRATPSLVAYAAYMKRLQHRI
jgi:hypothetical protein